MTKHESVVYPHRLLALTSLSWLLPVQLTPDGREIVRVHYDQAIEPAAPYQEYGVEDARICRIDNLWYMTTCSVSAERHCTTLHVSLNGLDYELKGIVLDHQNKDMILFEGKVGGRFMALTRPMGEVYFAYPDASPYAGGPSINLAQSPDAIHWKPLDQPGIRARKGSTSSMTGLACSSTPSIRYRTGFTDTVSTTTLAPRCSPLRLQALAKRNCPKRSRHGLPHSFSTHGTRTPAASATS